MKTVKLNLELMTIEQMLEDDARSYNEYEWRKKIRLYEKYGAQFYKVPAGDGYDYDRFFVQYTIDEGITLFKSFSYHSLISNAGFRRIELDIDNGQVKLFGFGDGGEFAAKNCKENRAIFAHNSRHCSFVYTTDF